jgi:protease-4
MFMRSSPSPEAQRMYDWLFDSIFNTCVQMIADGRGQGGETVRQWIDHGIYSAAKGVELGIIDAAEPRRDLVAHIKKQHGDHAQLAKQYGKEKRSTIDFSNPFAVFKIWADLLQGSGRPSDGKKDSVALVYVEGPIVVGAPTPSPFGSQGIAFSEPIRKALEEVADDASVKAVVMRVDSPGGSAVGSEVILQATQRVAAKKPLVVSMGNVAGSGGYYVACGTETIFADATTITASIGVVAGKLATKQMWESVGINWYPIARGENSGMMYSGEAFTEKQRETLQSWMDEVYEVFKGHVTRIRGDRLTKPIDEMAGGRVFTGRQALELGLVDRIGTLSDAIRFAADKAGLKTYDVRVVPRPKNLVELLFADLTGSEDDNRIGLDAKLGTGKARFPWPAVAPILNQLEPRRAAVIRRMLIQVEVLRREQVSLPMPEIVFGN